MQLDQLRISNEEQLAKDKERIKDLEAEWKENQQKIERLSDLNREMRDLIEQEREFSLEEIRRKDKAC